LRTGRGIPSLAILVLGAALFAADADAIPRYTARYEQDCILCHVNPTGGGQRTLYASQYLVPTEMVLRPFEYDELGKISPEISDNVIIGADLRTVARYSSDEMARPQNNFFHMQSDIYLSFQVDEKYVAYFDRGGSSTYEAFALARLLPWNGYLKTGRFTPAFGWKFADHNAFVREQLGFLPPAHTDVGMEIGLFPGTAAIQFALVNGNQGSTQDFNDELSLVVRAEYRRNFRGIAAALGGSYQRNDERPGATFSTHERSTGGPFGYLTWKRLSWVGEADWTRLSTPDSDVDTTGFVTSHEFAFQLSRGFDLVGTYSFYDPDIDLGAGAMERWAGGFELFYNPFARVSALVQAYRVEDGDQVDGVDYTQSVIQIHFLY